MGGFLVVGGWLLGSGPPPGGVGQGSGAAGAGKFFGGNVPKKSPKMHFCGPIFENLKKFGACGAGRARKIVKIVIFI